MSGSTPPMGTSPVIMSPILIGKGGSMSGDMTGNQGTIRGNQPSNLGDGSSNSASNALASNGMGGNSSNSMLNVIVTTTSSTTPRSVGGLGSVGSVGSPAMSSIATPTSQAHHHFRKDSGVYNVPMDASTTDEYFAADHSEPGDEKSDGASVASSSFPRPKVGVPLSSSSSVVGYSGLPPSRPSQSMRQDNAFMGSSMSSSGNSIASSLGSLSNMHSHLRLSGNQGLQSGPASSTIPNRVIPTGRAAASQHSSRTSSGAGSSLPSPHGGGTSASARLMIKFQQIVQQQPNSVPASATLSNAATDASVTGLSSALSVSALHASPISSSIMRSVQPQTSNEGTSGHMTSSTSNIGSWENDDHIGVRSSHSLTLRSDQNHGQRKRISLDQGNLIHGYPSNVTSNDHETSMMMSSSRDKQPVSNMQHDVHNQNQIPQKISSNRLSDHGAMNLGDTAGKMSSQLNHSSVDTASGATQTSVSIQASSNSTFGIRSSQRAVYAVSHITPRVTPEERALWREFHTPDERYLELRSRLGYVPNLTVTEAEIRTFGARARCVVYDPSGVRPLSLPLSPASYVSDDLSFRSNNPGAPNRVYLPANRVPVGATISTLESIRALSLVPILGSVAAKQSLIAAHAVTKRTEEGGWEAGRAEFERQHYLMTGWDQRVQAELLEKARNVPADKLPVVRARDVPLNFAAGVRGGPYDDTPKVTNTENNITHKLTVRLLETLTGINELYYRRRQEEQGKTKGTANPVGTDKVSEDDTSKLRSEDQMSTNTRSLQSDRDNEMGINNIGSDSKSSKQAQKVANVDPKSAVRAPKEATAKAEEDADDDSDYDLGDIFNTLINDRYKIERKAGHGSFGRVYTGYDMKSSDKRMVALKFIKKKEAFLEQANTEIRLLRTLGQSQVHRPFIVEMLDTFMYREHRCIVFERLSLNLFELLRMNRFHGISMDILTPMTYNILMGLEYIGSVRYRYRDCGRISSRPGIIHCDLKPENILLHSTKSPTLVKIIDFGSACFVPEKVYTYIQSRYYRAPEVLLVCSYGCPIDMWSLGCILFELFTGNPLFPGQDEADQVARQVEVLGVPPYEMVAASRKGHKHFDLDHEKKTVTHKTTQQRTTLEREMAPRFTRTRPQHEALLDLMKKMLCYDPAERITPSQALQHHLFSSIVIVTVNGDGTCNPNPSRPQRRETGSSSNPNATSSSNVSNVNSGKNQDEE